MREAPVDSLPPHSIEMEMCCLGSMILDFGEALPAAMSKCDAADFYLPKHQAIYSALIATWRKSNRPDVAQLQQTLRNNGAYDEVGGVDYLVELVESVPSCQNARTYAESVREYADRRRVIEAAERAISAAHLGEDAAQTRAGLFKALSVHLGSGRSTTRSRAIMDIVARIKAGQGNETGLPTGFRDIDRRIGGLLPGKIYYIAGRPGMGKSALCCAIAENVAESGHRASILSLEMDPDDLSYRLMSRMSGMDANHLRAMKPHDAEDMAILDDLAERVQAMDRVPLDYDYMPGASIGDIEAAARMHVANGSRLIVVDGLWLIRAEGSSLNERVTNASGGLTRIAGQLGVPFVVAHQLSRDVEKRGDRRPVLSDLRDSGSVEQDAYAVAMIYREAYYSSDPNSPDQPVEVIWRKGRGFATDKDTLVFDPATTTFGDLEQAY